MEATLKSALGAIVGARGVTEGAVTPTDTLQVAAVVRACAEHSTRLTVVCGPAPRPAPAAGSVVLSLARLAAVAVHSGAMVARAEAGASIADLLAAVAAGGLTPAGAMSTPTPAPSHVGSLLARGGVTRRALTGIEAVTGAGEVVRAGGLVQRDVAGYDLPALLLGSAGRLAVITVAWFRLQPAGTRLEAQEPQGVPTPGALSLAIVAAFDPGGVLARR